MRWSMSSTAYIWAPNPVFLPYSRTSLALALAPQAGHVADDALIVPIDGSPEGLPLVWTVIETAASVVWNSIQAFRVAEFASHRLLTSGTSLPHPGSGHLMVRHQK